MFLSCIMEFAQKVFFCILLTSKLNWYNLIYISLKAQKLSIKLSIFFLNYFLAVALRQHKLILNGSLEEHEPNLFSFLSRSVIWWSNSKFLDTFSSASWWPWRITTWRTFPTTTACTPPTSPSRLTSCWTVRHLRYTT